MKRKWPIILVLALVASAVFGGEARFEYLPSPLRIPSARNRVLKLATAVPPEETVSDIRVQPFIKTVWGQGDCHGGTSIDPNNICFNYYTPYNYICGCVATVGAQILKYDRHPTTEVATNLVYECLVDGSNKVDRALFGGYYEWDRMPDVPSSLTGCEEDAPNREAIGHLVHDVAVSVGSRFYADGTSAPLYQLVNRLPEVFGYSNVVGVTFNDGKGDVKYVYLYSEKRFKDAVIPNLEMGRPVAIGIHEEVYGHAALVDGYGYTDAGEFRVHVVLGWSGQNDGWYAPPLIESYDVIDTIIYNIFPEGGEGLSLAAGRVVDREGRPAANVPVFFSAMRTGEAVTNLLTGTTGSFALALPPGDYLVYASNGVASVATALLRLKSCISTDYTTDTGYYTDAVVPRIGNVVMDDLVLGEPSDDPIPVGPYVGECIKATIADLGVTVKDWAIVKSVKAEGLPKGLKLVKDKVSGDYYIEGVATEAFGEEIGRTAYVRITYADATQDLQPLALRFAVPLPSVFADAVVGESYACDVGEVFPEVAADWTLKGFPSGLKYDKKTTLAVSGTPKKAGRFTVSATSGKVDGSKFKNTYTAPLTVWPDADKVEWTTKAYEPVATNLWVAFGEDKDIASVSGLPSGLKYDKTTGAVTQFPKKAGTFAVTLKKTDKTTKGFLWTVLPADAPTFALAIPEATPVKDTKFQVVQGSNQSWPIAVPAGAKVSAKGLPSGMKLVKDKVTGAYSIQGYPTKAGDYLVTFKTVLNGVTSVTTTAITVKANPYAGSYRGYAIARQTATGPKLVAVTETTMAANGTVKLVYTEGKKKYTATAKGFNWTEDSNEATVSNMVLKAERTAVLWFGVEGAPFVTLEVFDLAGKKLTADSCDYGYWVEKQVAAEVKMPLAKIFSFVDGASNDFADVSATYNATKSTMAFTGTLFDGAKVKATMPMCRRGEGVLASDYGVAPFLVIGKDGTVHCFNWLDGLDGLEDDPEIFWIGDDGETVSKATPKKGD